MIPDAREPALREALASALDRAGEASESALRRLLDLLEGERIDGSALAGAYRILDEAGQEAQDALAEAIVGAWLAGAGRVAGSLPAFSVPPQQGSPRVPASALQAALANVPDHLREGFLAAMAPREPHGEEPPLPVPPLPLVEAAVEALREKDLLPYAEARALPEAARRRALAVAVALPVEAMGRLRGMLEESVRTGEGLRGFRARLREAMPEGAFPRAAVETTFRDAVQTSYAEGQERILATPGVGDLFPFVETLPIKDSRLSSLCSLAARSGIGGAAVYRRDDPAWDRLKPPRHPNCRCGTNPLTVGEAARRGVGADAGWVRIGADLERLLAQQGR